MDTGIHDQASECSMDEAKTKKDTKAILFIAQEAGKSIFSKIMAASKSKDAWKIPRQDSGASVR